MKLSHQAFIELKDDLVQTFYETATIDKWQGHRLLAVDGSVTQLPISDKLLEHFGKARSHAAMLLFVFLNFMILNIILPGFTGKKPFNRRA